MHILRKNQCVRNFYLLLTFFSPSPPIPFSPLHRSLFLSSTSLLAITISLYPIPSSSHILPPLTFLLFPLLPRQILIPIKLCLIFPPPSPILTPHQADSRKVDGRRILVDVERGRWSTVSSMGVNHLCRYVARYETINTVLWCATLLCDVILSLAPSFWPYLIPNSYPPSNFYSFSLPCKGPCVTGGLGDSEVDLVVGKGSRVGKKSRWGWHVELRISPFTRTPFLFLPLLLLLHHHLFFSPNPIFETSNTSSLTLRPHLLHCKTVGCRGEESIPRQSRQSVRGVWWWQRRWRGRRRGCIATDG